MKDNVTFWEGTITKGYIEKAIKETNDTVTQVALQTFL